MIIWACVVEKSFFSSRNNNHLNFSGQLKSQKCIIVKPETLPETIKSGPLCITDLFQNKSVAYF